MAIRTAATVGPAALLAVLASHCASSVGAPASPPAGENWTTYLGDVARTHYSTLDQIDTTNVADLAVAWSYDTGDRAEFQANPLIVDGVLYVPAPSRTVLALDAATGTEIWTWDPTSEREGPTGGRQRGLVHWQEGGDQRIFTGVGQHLYALDAATGDVVRSFGDNGSIRLGAGVEAEGATGPPVVTLNTPGLVFEDLYIVGGNTNGPGTIRAYDVRTGELRWIFYTIPRPGERGYETWPPDAYRTAGGTSNWTGTALDKARGILYVPTETATPDFTGTDREGANLFANSLVALDARTGERLWHYQIVHHDLLDKDLPTPPVLLTVTHDGREIDAVAQGTKHGLLFVFDRVTGEPLWPIEERPVPQSDLPGEPTWPTQPFPTAPPPLMRQIYTEADLPTTSPEAAARARARFERAGSFGAFPPPSFDEAIIFPGFDGGMEWGGAAADQDGIYYANINEMPWLYQLVANDRADGTPVSLGERGYMIQCGTCHASDRHGDPAAGFPSLVDLGSRQAKATVAAVIEQGGGRMPALDRLQDGPRRAIVDFLFGDEQPTDAYLPPGGRGRGGGGAGDPPYSFAGFRRWLDADGYPAITPPWGTLNAVDLNTGTIKWSVPLGEYPELTVRGLPPTGTENYGGPVVTAGGLIFIGATSDETFRAFDKETGEILWQARLPFGGNATPSTYLADGRQYVVISAGGGKSGRAAGGSIVAFALPD